MHNEPAFNWRDHIPCTGSPFTDVFDPVPAGEPNNLPELNEISAHLAAIRSAVRSDPFSGLETVLEVAGVPLTQWVRACFEVFHHEAMMERVADDLRHARDYHFKSLNGSTWWNDFY